MLEKLKREVLEANLFLAEKGLVVLTWGNVSCYDEESGLVVIKPSGLAYQDMKTSDMVIVDLNGEVVEGKLSPSSDTPTHLAIYRSFPTIKGIAHTHSTFATSFAQAERKVTAYGTTSADSFKNDIPLTRELKDEEILQDYELNTGKCIIEEFTKINPLDTPAVLVSHHGPFTFGRSAMEAAENSLILEEVCKMNYLTLTINMEAMPLKKTLHEKHHSRKHGPKAYYGQKK